MRMSEGEANEFSKCNFSLMARGDARDERCASRRGHKKNSPSLTGPSHLYAVCTNEGSVLVSLYAEGKRDRRRDRRARSEQSLLRFSLG